MYQCNHGNGITLHYIISCFTATNRASVLTPQNSKFLEICLQFLPPISILKKKIGGI